jgi:16S rRNA (guanine(966)-N(2))-methyltransferase RsmD
MGAEALCRGATTVIGIEQSAAACRIIRQNWQMVAQPDQTYEILKGNCLSQLRRLAGQSFDLIYFDPPYASGLYQPVLEALMTHRLLTVDAEVAIEHTPEHWRAEAPAGLEIIREKRYGNTQLTFLALLHRPPAL